MPRHRESTNSASSSSYTPDTADIDTPKQFENANMQNLDETITDPLNSVERTAITRIRQHSTDIEELRASVAALLAKHYGEASLLELRQFLVQVDEIERKLAVPRQIFSRPALAQAMWPTSHVEAARKLAEAVDEHEAAMQQGKGQIDYDFRTEGADHVALCDALERLLKSWALLRKQEKEAKASVETVVSRIDMAVEGRVGTVALLCDALLDKTAELHAAFQLKAEDGRNDSGPKRIGAAAQVLARRMKAILGNELVQETIDDLSVEIPTQGIYVSMDSAESGDPIVETPGSSPTAIDEDEDPLLQTVPGFSDLLAGDRLVQSVGLGIDLWHSVHIGDKSAIERLIEAEAVNGEMRDVSQHALAFSCVQPLAHCKSDARCFPSWNKARCGCL